MTIYFNRNLPNGDANEVYQYNGVKPVSFRGWHDGVNQVQYRLLQNGSPITSWVNAECDHARKLFSCNPILPKGPNIQIAAKYAGQPDSAQVVTTNPFHCGNVIVMLGQSQQTYMVEGTGNAMPVGSTVKQYLNSGCWIPAQAYNHDVWETPQGVGYAALAAEIFETTALPLGIINASVGGTSVAQWNATGEGSLQANTRDIINRFGGDAAVVVWNQGESDAQGATSYGDYYNRLGNVHLFACQVLGRSALSFKFVVCRTGGCGPGVPPANVTNVRQAQTDFANNPAFSPAMLLGPDMLNYTTQDTIHLSANATGYGAMATDLGALIAPHLYA